MSIHMSRRLFGKATLSVAALAVLTACGKNDSSVSADGTTTVRFTWWGNEVRDASTRKVNSLFETAESKIKVSAEPGVWSSYWDKLATQTAGNDMPDVIQMDQQYIAEYGGRGALMDLSTRKEIDTSNTGESAIKAGQIGEKLFGISTGQNAMAVFTNVKLFKDAGVELPDDKTWTWDDFIEISAKIAAKISGNSGAGYPGSSLLDIWSKQNGETLYTAEGKLGVSEGTIAKYYELILKQNKAKAGPAASINTEDVNAAVEQTLFATGKTAMSFWWSNQIGAVTAAVGNEVKMLRPPSVAGSADKNGLFYKPSMFWSISARSKHPEQAAKLVNFFMNDVEAAKIQLTDRGYPSNTKLQEAITPLLKPTDKATGDYLKAVEGEISYTPVIPPVGSGGLEKACTRYVDEVLFGRKTPAVAAKEFIAEAKAMIDAAAK